LGEGVEWIHVAQMRHQYQALMNKVLSVVFPYSGEFCKSLAVISSSRRILFYGVVIAHACIL